MSPGGLPLGGRILLLAPLQVDQLFSVCFCLCPSFTHFVLIKTLLGGLFHSAKAPEVSEARALQMLHAICHQGHANRNECPSEWAIRKKVENTTCWRGPGAPGTLSHSPITGMEVGTTTLENHLAVQPKPSIRLSYDPTERGTSIRQKVRTRTFIATLLILAPN